MSEIELNFNDVKFEDIVMTNDMNNILSNRKPDISHLYSSVMSIVTVVITTEDGHFQRLPVSVSWPHPIEYASPTFKR